MVDHWLKNGPPVYVAAAVYLGLTKGDKETSKKIPSNMPGKPGEEGNLNELFNLLSGSGGILNG